MGKALRFAILDSLRAWRGDRELDLGSPQQRTLLAVLLLHEGDAVPVDALITALWADAPPRSARGTLRTHVHRLRLVLGDGQDPVISFRGGAYALPVEPNSVDLDRFRRLVAEARVAADPARGFREALALWGEAPLGRVGGNHLDAHRARLAQLRLSTIEELAEVELDRGRHEKIIPELTWALTVEPLRERLSEHLMVALYRAGRQAEALAVHDDASRLLRAELGIHPGPGLRGLRERVLRGDPTLLPGRGHAVRPAQLPADLPVFVGREAELARAAGLLPTADGKNAAVVSGTAGVGKTTFALRWAHLVAWHFPDGQLHVDLRGFDARGAQDPAEAVHAFLLALGVPSRALPTDPAARAARYQELLADRRCLVVLDNARDAAQVRSLLPTAAGCFAIVTSRDPLADLVAADRAHAIPLDLLSDAETDEFLTRRVGPDRVGGEPEAARQIGALCTRLPLALAVVAARAVITPSLPLTAIAAEMTEARGGLDAFSDRDGADVRAVFSWSYRELTKQAARAFRLLGVHPGGEVTLAAVTALTGLAPAETRQVLDELGRAHLIIEGPVGRFTAHDLLRGYAAELLAAEESPESRDTALRGLLDHHVHSADAAFRVSSMYPELLPLAPPPPGVRAESFTDYEAALAWLRSEYPVLLALVHLSAHHRLDRRTLHLVHALRHFQDRQGHHHDLASIQPLALTAAERLGDRAGIGHAHIGLVRTDLERGRPDAALRRLDLVRPMFEESGTVAMSFWHNHVASIHGSQGDHRAALAHEEQALELVRLDGKPVREALALNNIGWYHACLGDHSAAALHCGSALAIFTAAGHAVGRAGTLDSLALAYHHLDRHDDAAEHFRLSAEAHRVLADRVGEVRALVQLGESHLAAGRPDSAATALRGALGLAEQIGPADADAVRAKLADLITD